jgi:type IV secretion system protein VirB10
MTSVTEEEHASGPKGKFPKNFAMILIGAVAAALTVGMYISNTVSTASKAERAKKKEEDKVLVENNIRHDIQAELEKQAKEAEERRRAMEEERRRAMEEERRRAMEEDRRLAEANKPEEPVVLGKTPKNAYTNNSIEDNYDPAKDKETVLREQAAQSPLLAIQKNSMMRSQEGQGAIEDPAIREALDLAREATREQDAGGPLSGGGVAAAKQDPNDAWLRTFAANKNRAEDYVNVRNPEFNRPVLHEGSVIPVVLQNALNSQLPGMVIASVTRDVYDSVTGRTVVVPRGTKFIGRFNSQVRRGQERLMFAFHRMIFPDGRDANLKGMEGSDQIGVSGVGGDVDTHFWEMLGSSLLIAMMTVGVENLDKSAQNVVVVGGGEGGGYGSAAGRVMVDTAKQSLQRYEGVPPTITIKPGTPLSVMVNKDIIL